MTTVKGELLKPSQAEAPPVSKGEHPPSTPKSEPSEVGPTVPNSVESLLHSALLSNAEIQESSIMTVSSSPSGMKTSAQSLSSFPIPSSIGKSLGNVVLQTQVSVSTDNPTRDKRYSQTEVGRVTVHVMDDHSMTVDYDGIVEMGDIRGKMIHMILEGYYRIYHKALQDAVAKGKRKD